MQALCLALLLVASPATIRDGTVIVLENSHRVVEMVTKSEVTHVGMILADGEETWVYEATPSEVRKLTLDRYYAELGEFNRTRRPANQLRVRLYQPAEVYSDEQVDSLRGYLENQLGRRYSLKGYVRGKPALGVHCAELVASAMAQAGRQQFIAAHRLSPTVLVTCITPYHDPPLDIVLPCDQKNASATWCQRSRQWWAGFFDWCGWACGESLSLVSR